MTPTPPPAPSASNELAGRTAIITGGTRGIGRAAALAFAAAGANVIITSRSDESAAQAATELTEELRSISGINAEATNRILGVGAHAAKPEAAERTCAIAIEEFGRIDCLVNNAGTNPCYGPVIDQDPALMQKVFGLNTIAPIIWAGAAVRAGLGKHDGASIVNVSSLGALEIEDNIGIYNSSKTALLHLTRQMARELAPVRVNAISPGVIRTKLSEALWKNHEDAVTSITPLGRIGEPNDCAQALLFLASPRSSWITGDNLIIDGGQRIGTAQPAPGNK